MERIKEKSDEDCVKILIGNKVDLAVTFMVDSRAGKSVSNKPSH